MTSIKCVGEIINLHIRSRTQSAVTRTISEFRWMSQSELAAVKLVDFICHEVESGHTHIQHIYKNSIHVAEKSKFIMYADDTTIYFNLEDFDPAIIERDINSELEKINVWLNLNNLSPNVKMTKSVIFNRILNMLSPLTCST